MKKFVTFIFLILLSCSKDSPTPIEQLTYALTVSASEGGSVDNKGGIHNENIDVIITATPAAGFTFSGWSGSADGTTNPLTVNMTQNKNITANFIRTNHPVISLVGSSNINLTVGETFTDPGAIAEDSIDGDLTSSITSSGTVDTSTTGTYTIEYSVSGAAGNITSVTRVVVVNLDLPPTITLTGSSTITLLVGDTYIEDGFIASDEVDGDLTSSIITTGTVDTSTVGTYTLVYSVSDTGNNTSSVTRTIAVKTPPDNTATPEPEYNYEYNEIIPLGGNAYNTSGVENLIIDSNGIQAWINTEIEFTVYVYSSKELDCNLTFPIETSQNSIIYSVSLNDLFFDVEVLPNKGEIDLGIHTLKKGYNTITLKGLSTADVFPKLTNLNIYSNELLSLNYVKENSSSRFYWGRRGPSIHLRYEFPQNTNIKWMYSEIEIPEGYDQEGLFAMANGSREGYFGMQVNSIEERRILFSIWSPYITDDPNDIPEDQRIQLIKSGEDVYIGEFGNEGSGGQSYLIYPWKAGVNYSFLKSVEPDGNGNTIYTAYFKDPEEGEWKLIASFLRPQTNSWYTNAHSFLENFYPEEGFKTRKAYYSNLWAINSNGGWYRLNNALFTTDDIGNREYRVDYQGGVELNKFYLMHCGFFDLQTEINKNLLNTDQRNHPSINFDLLP